MNIGQHYVFHNFKDIDEICLQSSHFLGQMIGSRKSFFII